MARTPKLPASQRPLSDNVIVTNSQRIIPISIPAAKRVVAFLLEKSGKKGMALSFVGKKKISSLHAQFFDDPTPTDCITFPIREPEFLGEVFVCPQVAQEYVAAHGGNVYQEITLYVVHGFLHLLGESDTTPAERKKMRAEESKWLKLLEKNNLWITK